MNPKTRKGLSTLLIWVLMGALILYMISGGFTTKTPDEITLQDFVKLVEDKKVQAVHETLGSGLYTGLYTGSNYTIKDLPNRADFTFTCSEEEFSKNMSLLIAKMQGKDADAVSSVDYPFTYTVVQPKGQSWLVVILPYVLLFGSMALFMWFMYRQQGGGKIVNVASALSFSADLNATAYTVAKHGIVGLTRSLAAELGRYNITANAIAPGFFESDANIMIRNADPKMFGKVCDRIPLNTGESWGDIYDLMGPMVFLCSPASDYVSGDVLVVDGGFKAQMV